MEFDDFLTELQNSQDQETACIEGSRQREVEYMRKHGWRFRRLFAMIPWSDQSLRVLEIGPTPFTLLIKKTCPHWDVWALDRTDWLKERFARNGVQLRSCDLDRIHMPLEDGFFDFILCAETLEHVAASPTAVVKQMARILKPSGRLLLTVPNLANLRNRVQFLFGASPLPNPDEQFKSDPMHGHGHVREYTRKELVKICRSAGFEVLKTQMIWKSPADILRLMAENRNQILRRGFYLGKMFHALLNTVTPSFRGNIILEARKPASSNLQQRKAA
jgi:SAM-dependent methyltransferase